MHTHPNNIGVLRLLLACAVIFGHAPEMIDNGSTRDPLFHLFGTVTIGGVAVAGFFLLSGYLITMSMERTNALWPYLERRLLRIVPGFLVAYGLSVFVLGPLLGVNIHRNLMAALENMALLHEPPTYKDLKLPYATVNGAMWTISFEFRCYLAVAALWTAGILHRRQWVALITLALLLAGIVGNWHGLLERVDHHLYGDRYFDLIVGRPSRLVNLFAIFLIGACAYLYRAEIGPRLTGRAALIALVALVISLFLPLVANAGLAIFGGAVIFWLAFKADFGLLRRINDRWDISYGTYLYGWPAAMWVLHHRRSIAPWELAADALFIALALGALSWWGVEKWTMDMVRSRRAKSHLATA